MKGIKLTKLPLMMGALLMTFFDLTNAYTATIMFGGMNSKCDSNSSKSFISLLKLGLNQHRIDCFENTFAVGMKFQAELACEKIKSSDYYRDAFDLNLVGLSQGGLIARYVLEDCDISSNTHFRNLLTIGTPNMGISQVTPDACNAVEEGMRYVCNLANGALIDLAYTDLMQATIAPAGYMRNTNNIKTYKEKSTFLPALNNENNKDTDQYRKHKARFESLNSLMLVLFEKDEIVFPPISQFFGEQTSGEKDRKEVGMEETEIYKNNDLGLKTLKDKAKIQFKKINDKHMMFTDDDVAKIFIPFLKQ